MLLLLQLKNIYIKKFKIYFNATAVSLQGIVDQHVQPNRQELTSYLIVYFTHSLETK